MSLYFSFFTSANFSLFSSLVFEFTVLHPLFAYFIFFSLQFQSLGPNSGAITMNQAFFLYIDVQSTPSYPLELIRSHLLLVNLFILLFHCIYCIFYWEIEPIGREEDSRGDLRWINEYYGR